MSSRKECLIITRRLVSEGGYGYICWALNVVADCYPPLRADAEQLGREVQAALHPYYSVSRTSLGEVARAALWADCLAAAPATMSA